jgi:hypothetical protein
MRYNQPMFSTRHQFIGFLILLGLATGCVKNSPVTPSDNDLLQIKVTRVYRDQPQIDAVRIVATRTSDGTVPLPGQNLEITADTGHVGTVIDNNDGTYDATWTGGTGEITVTVRDPDTTPVLQNRLTFLSLDYLDIDWDIPVKLGTPISTDGWETAPFLYPDGNRILFSYVTLDLASAAADVVRPIGQERPGQVTPQILNLFVGKKSSDAVAWWTGWTVEHPDANFFMVNPPQLSAPSITSDGQTGFCTVQEYTGTGYSPTTIYRDDPDFRFAPIPIGQPVDMAGLGEDNPYYDVSHGWLYFDTYDLSDPLSKQNIWASRSLGGGSFDVPELMSGGLNTDSIETQSFVYEPDSVLYFASDREQPDYNLSIWKVPVYGSQSDGTPELVARGFLAMGRPSISYDGEWLCFSYAREESGGANADIAIAPRLK